MKETDLSSIMVVDIAYYALRRFSFKLNVHKKVIHPFLQEITISQLNDII